MNPKNQITKLFISHATPEDNYFAGWLASKLSLMGYDVWCDIEVFKGGEDFWQHIERTIRDQAAKFIFVLSSTSIQKRGTLKELAVADKINDRNDFILPVRIDNISGSDLPTELIRLNYIDFYCNWAAGLRQLLEKLEKDHVFTEEKPASALLGFWKKTLAIKDNVIVAREEGYRANWFEITIPRFVYFHYPSAFAQFTLDDIPYAAFSERDFIVSFACEECLKKEFEIEKSIKTSIADFLKEKKYFIPATEVEIEDTNKKIIRLLNLSFSMYLLDRGLRPYNMASDTIYYFSAETDNKNPSLRINLEKYDKHSINLLGKSKGANWHYAIGGQAFLYPISAFSIDYHIIFTSQVKNHPLVKAEQHTYRRRLAKSWFNKKWRDLLIGSFLWLSNGNEWFPIPVCEHNKMDFKSEPILLTSQIGYIEPTKDEENEDESDLS